MLIIIPQGYEKIKNVRANLNFLSINEIRKQLCKCGAGKEKGIAIIQIYILMCFA